MAKRVDEERRTFFKGLLVAGAALFLRNGRAQAARRIHPEEGGLYRETEAFRAYYQSLRD